MPSSIDRVFSAIGLEEPDRIPLGDVDVATSVVEEVIGRRLSSEAEKAKALVKLGFDLVVIRHRIRGHGQSLLSPDPAGKWEPRWLDEETYVGEWSEVRRVATHMHSPIRGMIRNPEDLDSFTPPRPDEPGRIDPVIEVLAAVGEDVPVFALLHDAFELPWIMLGSIQRLLVEYHRRPRFAQKLAEISTDFNVEMAKILLDAGVHGILTGDDYAFDGGPFMTPAQFDRFVQPYLKRLIRVVHRRGAPFIKHTDGDISPILPSLLRAHPDVLNPIQSEAGLSLRQVKNTYGNRVALMGNVDCSTILHFGSPSDVFREVRRCCDEAASGGGYLLSSSNTIYSGTRPENLVSLIRASRKLGRYCR